MDMRDKLARALWLDAATFPGKEAAWDAMSAFDRESYYRSADAALDALREPDEGMVSDGAFQIFRGERITADDLDAARRVWRGMISRAASAEPVPPGIEEVGR